MVQDKYIVIIKALIGTRIFSIEQCSFQWP